MLRVQGDPGWLRALLDAAFVDPGVRVTARRALDLKDASLEAEAKADAERAAAEAAERTAAERAAAQTKAAAARTAADVPLPRAPRDCTGATGSRGRAESVDAASERSRTRSADAGGRGKKDAENTGM